MIDRAFYAQLADIHMHTHLCGHAKGEPVDYACRAVELGLAEIGISEHCPMPANYDQLRLAEERFPDYLAMVEAARKAFPKLRIKLGVEAEYCRGQEEYVRRFLGRADWDYVLGSVHYLGMWCLDDPKEIPTWKKIQDLFATWKEYFQLWKAAARTGLYDSLAHPDLVKKFGFFPKEPCEELFEDALRVVAEKGICIEINTAGLRKPVKEIYPSEAFLQIAGRLEIPITLGSDSHAPIEVGAGFREAVRLARDCGYTQYARFEKRKRTMWPLP
jgi:histidinol-phosphatase (PHP family)